MPLLSRHPSSYPLSEDIPALMISSTNNKLLAITVLQIQKKAHFSNEYSYFYCLFEDSDHTINSAVTNQKFNRLNLLHDGRLMCVLRNKYTLGSAHNDLVGMNTRLQRTVSIIINHAPKRSTEECINFLCSA